MTSKNFFWKRYKKMLEFQNCNLIPDEKTMFSFEAKKAIRVNPLKANEKEIRNKLKNNIRKHPFIKNAFTIEKQPGFSLSSMPEHLLGKFYMQELSSQLPALILNPNEKDVVLDMCSAPGSKTTQISELMNNKGTIVATDSSSERIKSLKSNLERMGVENVVVFRKDARFVNDLNIKFTKILLDAPCMGNYSIDKKWFEMHDFNAEIQRNASTQKKMIAAASKSLTKGGVLVYSTCSLEVEENEEIIDWALNNLNLKLEKIDLAKEFSKIYNAKENCFQGLARFNKQYSEELSKTLRIWPHLTRMSGFFIAKLVKIS